MSLAAAMFLSGAAVSPKPAFASEMQMSEDNNIVTDIAEDSGTGYVADINADTKINETAALDTEADAAADIGAVASAETAAAADGESQNALRSEWQTFVSGAVINGELLSPDQSYYQYQWGLKNDGSALMVTSRMVGPWVYGPGMAHAGRGVENTVTRSVPGVDIGVEAAWDYYEQSTERRTVTVAVIDTGVDVNHTDLAGSIWVNTDEIPGDGIDNDGNGYIDDVNGWNFYANNAQVYTGSEDDHGTHGAGTIAGAWDGKGITGIADGAYVKIMVLKALGTDNGLGTSENIKNAIRYAEANGADICNLSIGTYSYDAELEQMIRDSSMLFVVSAGNGDQFGIGYSIDETPMYPASYGSDNIITVANLMFDGTLDQSSNYGAVSVDIAAPGSYILSTTADGYGFMSGTSMSAPMVTGAAALIYSCRTDMSLMDVKQAIMQTATQTESLSGRVVSGGWLNVGAAITYGLNG